MAELSDRHEVRVRGKDNIVVFTADSQEVAKRYRAGESVDVIARARKRSPRAIELRLQRLGLIAGEQGLSLNKKWATKSVAHRNVTGIR